MSDSPKERIPDEDDTTEAPLTMAASVVLTHLPKDASKALETAGNLKVEKSTKAALVPSFQPYYLPLPPPQDPRFPPSPIFYHTQYLHPRIPRTHTNTPLPQSHRTPPTHRLRPAPHTARLQTLDKPAI